MSINRQYSQKTTFPHVCMFLDSLTKTREENCCLKTLGSQRMNQMYRQYFFKPFFKIIKTNLLSWWQVILHRKQENLYRQTVFTERDKSFVEPHTRSNPNKRKKNPKHKDGDIFFHIGDATSMFRVIESRKKRGKKQAINAAVTVFIQ